MKILRRVVGVSMVVLLCPNLPAQSEQSLGQGGPARLHEPRILAMGTTLGDQEIDAFGLLAAGGHRPVGNPSTLPQSNQLNLAAVAAQLRLQGINSGEEAIINTFVVHLGGKLKIKIDSELVQLSINEVHDDAVLLGWDKSDSTFLLQMPGLQDPVTLSDTPNVFAEDEVEIHPVNSVTSTGDSTHTQYPSMQILHPNP